MTREKLLEETVVKLAARIERLEAFIVTNRQSFDDAETMLTESNLRETINEIAEQDFYVTASVRTET